MRFIFFILFISSYRLYSQLTSYTSAKYVVTKNIKNLKLKNFVLNKVVKVNIYNYTIYLDQTEFNICVSKFRDYKEITAKDTVDINSYLSNKYIKDGFNQCIYDIALSGKMKIYKEDGSQLDSQLFIGKFKENNNTGCIITGNCIYIKNPETILITGDTMTSMTRTND